MNYSSDVNSVRVDFFRVRAHLTTDVPQPGLGQWMATEAVEWPGSGFQDCLIQDAFAAALFRHLCDLDSQNEFDVLAYPMPSPIPLVPTRLSNAVAICLAPYHVHSIPVSLTVKEAFEMVNSRPGILRRLV